MSAAATILSLVLAALLTYSAIMKLTHRAPVVEAYARAGVPEDKLDFLATILLAGVAGLLVGLFWAPIGVAAAAALACYFLVAIASHIRAGDAEHLATPVAVELIAAATLALRIATL
ncbi:MAG: DoxX family protein [Solirubrobacterales bacterium]